MNNLIGNNDIQKAVFLLREIDAWLSLNQSPSRDQLSDLRKSIKNFTQHFPECWECGDTGYLDENATIPCSCNDSDWLNTI